MPKEKKFPCTMQFNMPQKMWDYLNDKSKKDYTARQATLRSIVGRAMEADQKIWEDRNTPK